MEFTTGVTKGFDGRVLFDGRELPHPKGRRMVGVVGPNGTGKTTLFKMVMGLEQPQTPAR